MAPLHSIILALQVLTSLGRISGRIIAALSSAPLHVQSQEMVQMKLQNAPCWS